MTISGFLNAKKKFYLDGVDLTLAELQMVHYSLHLPVCAAS